VYGDYKDLDPADPHIFVYTRTLGPEAYLVVHNFSGADVDYTLPAGMKAGALVTSNLPGNEQGAAVLHLKGWESRIYRQ
jgi:oligo-1,6-glucosidase